MSASERPRLVYVLPRFDPATGSHFFHLTELVRLAAASQDILLVIERSAIGPVIPGVRIRALRHASRLFRPFELSAIFLGERFSGCRNFYVHYSFSGALAAWFVTRVFGGSAYYWNSGEPWKYDRPWLEELIFRFILRHAILVTNPPSLAKSYERRYGLRGDRIRILPHFIEAARFQAPGAKAEARAQLRLPPDAKIVLFAHRLSRRKGAHLIPDVAAGVTKSANNAIFLVVGNGPERGNLESGIRKLALADSVRLLGEVPQRDIVPYFRAADAVILPSEEEGLPHVILEAAAAGVPFVASDVGGIREALPAEFHSWIVPAGDVPGYAAKLREAIALSEAERTRMASSLRQWVRAYDVRAVAPKFLALFDRR